MQGWLAPEATISSDAPATNVAIKKSWQEFIWLFLFFAILSLGILSPISSTTTIPNFADYINHLSAVIQTKMAFAQGQFPLRTMPYSMHHLGYPLFQFYSPSSFLFIGLIYWLVTPSNPLIAINIALWCGLMLGGLSMYYLALWFIRSKPSAILAGVIYLFAPYYLVLVDHLGGFQEILAFGLLPAIFYWTLQRFYHPHDNTLLLKLSLGLYVFFTLHMPTAIYAILLFGIVLTTLTLQNKKRFHNLISVAIVYAFAGMLGAWFLVPGILFQKYFVISNTYSDSAHLMLYHPTLSNLFFPAAALSAGDKTNALQSIHPTLGLPILMGVTICVFAYFNKLSSGKKRADYFMPALLQIFFIAFMLAWSPVNFWRFIPQPLWVAQYCWRLVGQVSWIGALLASWAIYWLFKGKLDIKHVVLGAILIIVCGNPWFGVAEHWETSLADFMKNPDLIYNADAVTINYNKFPTMVNEIESINVDASQVMHFNTPYHVPQALVRFALNPAIVIHGKVDENGEITALVNQSPVASKKIKSGEFIWSISLDALKHEPSTSLSFVTKKNNITAIAVNDFTLTGFQLPEEVMNLSQVSPYCHQDKTRKVCNVKVPVSVKILELPQLYYPHLLKITLNGKEVPYQSILDHSQLVAFITPEEGALNKVTVEFRGLPWANHVSWMAWGGWVLLLLLYCLSVRRRKLSR